MFLERDSRKDEAIVFIFIFATSGLLAYALFRPWIEKYLEVWFFFHITSDTCCFSSMVTHSCLGRERTTTVYSRWWTRWMISFELLCIYRRSPNGPWIMCDKLGGNCVESIFYSCICIVLCLGQPFYNSMTFHQMAHLVSDGLPRRSKWPVRGGSDWLPTRKQDIEPSSLLDTKQVVFWPARWVCFLSSPY